MGCADADTVAGGLQRIGAGRDRRGQAPPAAMLDQKHFRKARFYMLSNHTLDRSPSS